MADKSDDGAWFAPKRAGYGTGRPIAWQGWAMRGGHLAIIALGAALLRRQAAETVIWAIGFSLLLLPLYAARTRGGWKWRWPRRR